MATLAEWTCYLHYGDKNFQSSCAWMVDVVFLGLGLL